MYDANIQAVHVGRGMLRPASQHASLQAALRAEGNYVKVLDELSLLSLLPCAHLTHKHTAYML